jgi:hypothetical protein
MIEKISRHYNIWKKTPPRAPPIMFTLHELPPDELSLEYEFFTNQAS